MADIVTAPANPVNKADTAAGSGVKYYYMGDEKQKSGGYKLGSAMIWAAGQWAVCWFVTEDSLLHTISACFSAFFAGWTTSSMLGRFARWGANAGVMMILGLLVGLAIFSGAFSGVSTLIDLVRTKELKVDWDGLQAFLLSKAALAPAAMGPLSGLYVRMRVPSTKKK